MIRIVLCWLLLIGNTYAGELRLAVAANFAPSLDKIIAAFESEHGFKPIVSVGSSGQLYAQIINGADFDIFFSADAARPTALRENGFGTSEPATYALGQLALFTANPIDCSGWQTQLGNASAGDIAIANPKLAPYGAAAKEVLDALNIRSKKMPISGNVAMTLNWLDSGNVMFALAAAALKSDTTSYSCAIPSHWHKPIKQNMLALNSDKNTQLFWEFMSTPAAQNILLANGYKITDER